LKEKKAGVADSCCIACITPVAAHPDRYLPARNVNVNVGGPNGDIVFRHDKGELDDDTEGVWLCAPPHPKTRPLLPAGRPLHLIRSA